MSDSRIFVGVPTRGYAYAPSLLRAFDLARRCGRDVVLEMTSPMEYGRTRLASRFLESDAEYLLTIDDDVVAPEGALERLLALGAPVATAAYPLVADGRVVWGVKASDADDWMIELPATVFPVKHTGLGFTLIHRDVFDRIRKPWFQFGAAADGRVVGEDTWFSNGVTKAGMQILCDGSIRCSHFKDGMDLLEVLAANDRQ